jgi:hypothetical protein
MIPKIIHQTYKTIDNLPSVYSKCQDRIKELHPDWEYRFWTDEDMYKEVRDSFPELYLVFMNLPRKILQIDVFRYCLMAKYGGLYADLDYMFRKPFDILDSKVVLPISRDFDTNYPRRFGNCVFASEPGHPFWFMCINDIIQNTERLSIVSDSDVMDSKFGTGPGFVTHMYYTCFDLIKKTITTPDRFLFHPPSGSSDKFMELKDSYGIHYCTSMWVNGRL